ncbi:SIS domain-containing protein [Clostridium sp. Marseille-P3244]|uniref:SIS domain-containing protein n=1 Tax=Clostridium sp. Marseille-P3244 TaxID=1871020 RepID=UPI0009315B52|nr:SIS domain-containing protein [Clostridium sp. Marseille-P3244]
MEKYTLIGNIKDQGQALRDCFARKDEHVLPLATQLPDTGFRKIYVTGSGSSYHAAVVIKYYLQKFLDAECQYIMPNLFTWHEETNPGQALERSEILVIGISQSGNSTSTLNALKKARSLGHTVLGITENRLSKMASEDYHVLYLTCGKEHVPPETRGYTVTLLTAYLLALCMADKAGKIPPAALSAAFAEIKSFTDTFDDYINESALWFDRNKSELYLAEKIGITGYGLNYGTAIEAQLKLYECTHLPSVGYEAEEFVHGHVFAYDSSNYLFTIGSKSSELQRMARLNSFYREKVTPHVFTVTAEDIPCTDKDLKFSRTYCDELMAIAYIVPFQILASKIADHLGINTSDFEMLHIGWPARD